VIFERAVAINPKNHIPLLFNEHFGIIVVGYNTGSHYQFMICYIPMEISGL
jgi:hypothetical protein